MGYILGVFVCVGVVVALFFISRSFSQKTRKEWASHVVNLLITLVATFLGVGLGISATWHAYNMQQKDLRDRLVAALLFESGQNQALLSEVMKGGWRETSIGTSFPNTAVAESALSQPYLYLPDTDRGMVTAVAHYRDQIEATGRTMEFMHNRFGEQGALTEANLFALRRICGNSLAASYALQDLLDDYSRRQGLRLGTQEQFERFLQALRKHHARVEAEATSEASEREGWTPK